MRASSLMATVSALTEIGRPCMIEGSPGLGKTQCVKQVADDRNVGFIQIHAPLMQPEDYGMPVVNAARDGITFVVPDKFPMEGSDHPDHGILLIDEMPQADNSGQKILANLIQERELHGRHLKKGWSIVATGNKQSDRSGANRILSHLRNRMTTLEFEPHLDDWCNWALQHNIDSTVISFLRFKSALLFDFDPQRDFNPTPRAWSEGVSPIIGKVPDEFEAIKGAVGEGAAAEFIGFLKIARSLPNPDSILMDPTKGKVPTDPSVLYALSGAIAARASETNFERVMTYSKRMPPEFAVMVVRDSVQRVPALTSTRAFTDWAMTEGAKVLL